MMTAIAASGGVSIGVSIIGKSKPSSAAETPWRDQRAAEQYAEDDRADGGAFDPAVGDDELMRRQELGQDAVLRRRIRGGAEPDDRVGQQRMHVEQHQRAAEDLDRVGDQHHATLRHRIGERADERREHTYETTKLCFSAGVIHAGSCSSPQQRDRGDQQRVVGERRKELRRHDGVEAGFHGAQEIGRGGRVRACRTFAVGLL